MRIGRAPIGSPDPAAHPLSSDSPRPPSSDRLCDAVVLAFALWTVCCHAMVAAGRGLGALLCLYAAVRVAGLWLRRRLSPVPEGPRPSVPSELSGSARPMLW